MAKRLTIGVLIGNAGSAHTLSLMKGINEEAMQNDVNVLFFLGVHTSDYYRNFFSGAGGSAEDENYDYQCNVVYDYALLGALDALIISYGSLCIFLEENDKKSFLQRFSGLPYVLMEDSAEDGRGSSVITDNYGGMRSLLEHLICRHGCRSITYLAGPKGNRDAEERLAAVWDAARQHGLPFSEDRIRYGDYSACVDAQAEALFSRYPDMDAMVCANDLMASAAYKIAERHGRTVGRDLAITGFDDDSQLAPYLEPPLTTVRQNAYSMGALALRQAAALCRGEKPQAVTDAAVPVIRTSCGCEFARGYPFPKPPERGRADTSSYADAVAEIFCGSMLIPDTNRLEAAVLRASLVHYLQACFLPFLLRDDAVLKTSVFAETLRTMLDGAHRGVLAPEGLLRVASAYLKDLGDQQTDERKRRQLSALNRTATEVILASEASARRNELIEFQKETWFMPLISRNMIDRSDSEQAFYRAALQKIPAANVRSGYLYVLETPLRHCYGETWRCPDPLRLAACLRDGAVESFPPEERPAITAAHGFAQACGRSERFSMCAFPLFSGAIQYGLLFAEIDPTHFDLMYLVSQQINVGLEFYRLAQKQKKAKEALEIANRQLNEKNEILGVLSQYDALTGCLNRRGFLEAAMAYLHAHDQMPLQLYFADVDHLKQINDCFGHAEGDYAIRAGARALLVFFGTQAVTARIGGDEFVVLTAGGAPRVPPAPDAGAAEDDALLPALPPLDALPAADGCIAGVRSILDAFNAASAKPYYVELSVGCRTFFSDGNTRIVAEMNEADHCLYEAKKRRRAEIFR